MPYCRKRAEVPQTGGYVIYDHFFANYIPSLDVEKEKVEVESYHVYGRYLNLEGKLDLFIRNSIRKYSLSLGLVG